MAEFQNSRLDVTSMFNINDFIARVDKFKEKINEKPTDFAPSPEVTRSTPMILLKRLINVMCVVINQNVDILTEFHVKHVETSSKDPSN